MHSSLDVRLCEKRSLWWLFNVWCIKKALFGNRIRVSPGLSWGKHHSSSYHRLWCGPYGRPGEGTFTLDLILISDSCWLDICSLPGLLYGEMGLRFSFLFSDSHFHNSTSFWFIEYLQPTDLAVDIGWNHDLSSWDVVFSKEQLEISMILLPQIF